MSPQVLSTPGAIEARHLSRRFGSKTVLDQLDLNVAPGQFVALLGESGSGKTTLLRALAGLDQDATATGKLTLTGNVSVLFQDARLLPWLSVLENLTLGLEAATARPAALQLLQEVGLAEQAHAWPATLSGGQKQRAALVRSLLRTPHILLADEPFAALDALTRLRMQGLLRRLVERTRPTVILVTHDVDEALLLADRILVLEQGRIAQDQAVSLSHPRRADDPGFAALRQVLLKRLGVESLA